MTGIGDRRTIFGSASASSIFGTAHAHDLAARRGERRDLRGRRLDIVRLRQRHRLDDDGRAAADLDAADSDLTARWPRAELAAADLPDVVREPDEEEQAARARSRSPRPARRPRARPRGRGCPRSSENTMCPPSSGSSGSRFSSASERLSRPSTQRYVCSALCERLRRALDDPDRARDLLPVRRGPARERDAPISFVITAVSFTDSQVACGTESLARARGRTGPSGHRLALALAADDQLDLLALRLLNQVRHLGDVGDLLVVDPQDPIARLEADRCSGMIRAHVVHDRRVPSPSRSRAGSRRCRRRTAWRR